ncbi:hypothetical protein AVEN_104034-1 [Araneus ventricosus]|uniref:Uncharacterized protein n=1 Tax=Araneus ventricosus TaxID=182803 RepID=A0A4Y2EJV6_ARAVE|nr:hypothetical protein AVEN_104034-1 [Araneus ventricosus]
MFTKGNQRSWIKIEVALCKNTSECYYALREACALLYRTLARWVKAFIVGRNETADSHRISRPSIPQHQIHIIMSPFHTSSVDCSGIIRRSWYR